MLRTHRRCPPGNGHVQLRDVTLRYEDPHDELGASALADAVHTAPQSGRAVLRDIDLDVPAGRTVALVGPTGSGKTSLVALISRLYDPVAGEVLLDGADVREVDRALRARAPWRSSATTPSCSPRASPRTSPTPGPGRRSRGDRTGRAPRAGARVHRAPAAGL